MTIIVGYMNKKKEKITVDVSTEEKIKDAACKVFTKKGYAATRTRDIAEEAGINLALLNYYFRSKEKLFAIIMTERMQKYFGTIQPIMCDEQTSLEYKLEKIVENYTEILLANPDLPIFILSEIRNDPEAFYISHHREIMNESSLVRQVKERNPELNPYHFLFNLLGMTIFPFLSLPVFKFAMTEECDFNEMIRERKKLIPEWVKGML